MEILYSINSVPIRLTEERWEHIVNNKPYMERYHETMFEAIENPNWVLRGYAGSLIAVLVVAKHKYLHVVYKETSQDDGFVITAFIARSYNRRMVTWSQNS